MDNGRGKESRVVSHSEVTSKFLAYKAGAKAESREQQVWVGEIKPYTFNLLDTQRAAGLWSGQHSGRCDEGRTKLKWSWQSTSDKGINKLTQHQTFWKNQRI